MHSTPTDTDVVISLVLTAIIVAACAYYDVVGHVIKVIQSLKNIKPVAKVFDFFCYVYQRNGKRDSLFADVHIYILFMYYFMVSSSLFIFPPSAFVSDAKFLTIFIGALLVLIHVGHYAIVFFGTLTRSPNAQK